MMIGGRLSSATKPMLTKTCDADQDDQRRPRPIVARRKRTSPPRVLPARNARPRPAATHTAPAPRRNASNWRDLLVGHLRGHDLTQRVEAEGQRE